MFPVTLNINFVEWLHAKKAFSAAIQILKYNCLPLIIINKIILFPVMFFVTTFLSLLPFNLASSNSRLNIT